ncbi:calmodulin, striated muscle-like [Dermacentor albipictus]|uniref:calmodulin, striated muscle-like n=1 Tax=Dermacentor albipictus TaxID=60249 RepID=UPI0038FCB836
MGELEDLSTVDSGYNDDAELREVFVLLDRDCDLELSFDELKTAVRALGLAVTEAEMEEVREELEACAGRTTVDYMGFLSVLAKLEFGHLRLPERSSAQEAETRRALEILDPSGTGLVSVRDVRWLLTSIGEKLTVEEVDQVLGELGCGGEDDDRVPYKELVEMLFRDS